MTWLTATTHWFIISSDGSTTHKMLASCRVEEEVEVALDDNEEDDYKHSNDDETLTDADDESSIESWADHFKHVEEGSECEWRGNDSILTVSIIYETGYKYYWDQAHTMLLHCIRLESVIQSGRLLHFGLKFYFFKAITSNNFTTLTITFYYVDNNSPPPGQQQLIMIPPPGWLRNKQ